MKSASHVATLFAPAHLLRRHVIAVRLALALPRKPQGSKRHSTGPGELHLSQFHRAQLIGYMKQLQLADLNARTSKDHLPMDPPKKPRRWPTTPRPASSCTPRAPFISRRMRMPIFAASSSTASAPASRSSSRRSGAGHAASHREVREGVRHPLRDPQPRAGGQDLGTRRSTC